MCGSDRAADDLLKRIDDGPTPKPTALGPNGKAQVMLDGVNRTLSVDGVAHQLRFSDDYWGGRESPKSAPSLTVVSPSCVLTWHP